MGGPTWPPNPSVSLSAKIRFVRAAARPLVALLMLGAVACQTVPLTNRSQLLLIPEGTELQLGLSSYQDILKKARVSHDPALNEQITRVGTRTGILPITRDDAGLAAVLGHEVSHAIARHGGERISQQLAVQGGLLATQAALAGHDAPTTARRSACSCRGAGCRNRRPTISA